MSYPSTFDTFVGTVAQGNTQLATNDHALDHRQLGSAAASMQTAMGTTGGTNIHKDFVGGNFPARINASNVLQQPLSGTINNSLFGTVNIVGGTIVSTLLGTNQITGGTVTAALLGTNQIQGGTVANAAIGTPTLLGGTIAVSGTVVPVTPGAALAPTVGTLSDAPSGTIAINAQAAQIFEISMGTTAGNRTLGTPANPTNGQLVVFKFKQNTNNTGTIVYPAIYRFGSSGTPSLGTQSTWNYTAFRYTSTDTKWDNQGASLGLI